jgi:hypothetical protein
VSRIKLHYRLRLNVAQEHRTWLISITSKPRRIAIYEVGLILSEVFALASWWKEIIDLVEPATDSAEVIAYMIEGIV